ncbi:IgA-specific metalloendopeptidase, partial [Toxoplasma gondii TgCatPRC2]
MTQRAILLGLALVSALALHAAAINSTEPAPYEDAFEVLGRTDQPTASQGQPQPSDEDQNRDVAESLEAKDDPAKTTFSLRGSSGRPVNEQEGLEKNTHLTKTVGQTSSLTEETVSSESSSFTEEPFSDLDDEAALQALSDFFTRLASQATTSPLAPETTTDSDEQAVFDPQEQAPQENVAPEPQEEVAATSEEENVEPEQQQQQTPEEN